MGYRSATVRDIVQRAGVNQAAINYHFHRKDVLYLEVIKQAFEKVNFLGGDMDRTDPMTPEQQLRMFMEKMITSLYTVDEPDCKFTRLVARELAEPSGILDMPMRYPDFAINTIRRFFPADTSEHQIMLATFWLLAQCSIIEQAHAFIEKMPQNLKDPFKGNKAELLIFFSSLILNGLVSAESSTTNSVNRYGRIIPT